MSELSSAIRAICEEKGLSFEAVVTTIESALAAAYRKDFGQKNQNIKIEFDPETGKSKVFDIKTVVEDMPEESLSAEADAEATEAKEKENKKSKKDKKEEKQKDDKADAQDGSSAESMENNLPPDALIETEERKFNPRTEIQISAAKLIKKTAKIGDEIKTKLEVPEAYGRMAAQTAKQVIIQRLREAEREMIFNEFKDKEKEVVSGVVQRREGRIILVDLGKTAGYLLAEEQIFGEKYNPGDRIKVYVKEVRYGSKGAEVLLSRTSDEILKKVFYLEIPEISNGLVELKAVAREAGSRSKVAVWTDSENVDPIGSCVGQRGARIQTIINELGGEKVDIILFNEDSAKFIANALSPAKIQVVNINKKEKKATVKVLPDQLSLAIGKNGQNARLAARLTGWKINIIGEKEEEKKEEEIKEKKEDKEDKKKKPSKDKSIEKNNKKDIKEKDIKKKNQKEKEQTKEGQAKKEEEGKEKGKKKEDKRTKQDHYKRTIYADLVLIVKCKDIDKNLFNKFDEKLNVFKKTKSQEILAELINLSKDELRKKLAGEFDYLTSGMYFPYFSYHNAYVVAVLINRLFKGLYIEDALAKIFHSDFRGVHPDVTSKEYLIGGWIRMPLPDGFEEYPARLLIPYYFLLQLGFKSSDEESDIKKQIRIYEGWIKKFRSLSEDEFQNNIYSLDFDKG